jgi:hypothetical protein
MLPDWLAIFSLAPLCSVESLLRVHRLAYAQVVSELQAQE